MSSLQSTGAEGCHHFKLRNPGVDGLLMRLQVVKLKLASMPENTPGLSSFACRSERLGLSVPRDCLPHPHHTGLVPRH